MSTMETRACQKFIPLEQREIFSVGKSEGFKFRLVSYNILAQAYVKREQFPHSPSACRKWKTRSQAILNLLKSLGADICCLQEVDEYDSFYKENMDSHGYDSIYLQRTGKKPDGCGIFFKNNIAELVLEEKIDYNDLVEIVQDDALTGGEKDTNTEATEKDMAGNCGDSNDPRIRLKRDCVGIMVAFRLKDPSHHVVIVANTHLYWDPNWADVKLAQAKYLLSRLAQFKTTVSKNFECSPSVVVAGDFNSTPGDKVYEYLTSGTSPTGELPDCVEDVPIALRSVYATVRGEPLFTNYTPGFTGTLDYIFLSTSSVITPVSYLELPDPDSKDIVGGLPNYHHPSDHLPIGVEFEVASS